MVPTLVVYKGGAPFDSGAAWWSDGVYVPQAGDDIAFWDGYSASCPDFQGPPGGGAYRSITLDANWGTTSGGKVTLAAPIQTQALVVRSGTIDQPSGDDITVGGTDYDFTDLDGITFSWTGGTINSTANLTNLILDGSGAGNGANGLIAPTNAGTVDLGSNFTLENGATATMQEGTIDVNKSGIQFTTSTGSSFAVNPGALHEAIIGVIQPALPPGGFVQAGTSWSLLAGAFSFAGAVGNAGTVTLYPNTVFSAYGDAATHEGYVQWGQDSATYLYGGSVLASPEQVLIQGGTLATVWSDDVGSGSATVVASTFEVSGGDIYVAMQQGLHVNFGEFLIDGNLQWSGGTFHPYVMAGGNDDVWRTTTNNFAGTFTISGGTVAPIYLDSDYGTSSLPNSGDSWKVLRAAGGFTDNTAPSVDNATLWMMEIGAGVPPTSWYVTAK